jgi:type IV pilus assembly protein PilM
MAGLANIFKPTPGMRPRLACEIRPEGVIAARATHEKHGANEPVLAFAPLPEGALTPGLKVPNLANRPAAIAAMNQALDATSPRDRALTLVVPDAAARVLLLDFDALPNSRAEALPVVRFRLRKMVPFDVETAAVSYQAMAHREGAMSVLVTVMPGEVLAEYEAAVREAGYEPGAVLPSTLAAVAVLGSEGAPLVVNHSGDSVTTAVAQGDELLLHRSIDLPAEADARDEEIARAVITTLAWYEDTLHAAPATIGYAGPGGAAAAAESRWLGFVDRAPRVEDLVAAPGAGMMTSIPAGVAAGVMGALAS